MRVARKQAGAWSNTYNASLSGASFELDDFERWRILSLYLLINRHCPDCFDDDEVSQHLRHVWTTQKHLLPHWEL